MSESPNLPIEIIERVVQLAARQNPTTGFNLLLVSRDVREWTEPALYDRINLRNEATKTLFRACVKHRTDTAFLRRSVHEITTKTFTYGLLSVLSEIQRMSIEMTPVDSSSRSYSIQLPPTGMAEIPTLTHVIFSNLSMEVWRRRSLPPNLTHLQLYKLHSLDIFLKLSLCHSLVYIMVHFVRLPYIYEGNVVATIIEHIPSYSTSLRTISAVLPLAEPGLDLMLEKKPRLLLVNVDRKLDGARDDVMDCEEELLYQFGLWDQVDAFRTKTTAIMDRLDVTDSEGTW